MKLTSIFLLIGFYLVSASSFAQIDKAESAIQKIMLEHPVVGLSVAVVKDGKLFYTHSFGLKNKEENIPLTDHTLFRIASISKSFTVTSLLQLVENKKLKLTDDVSKLMGFPVRNPLYPDKIITLKMLLSHTSGINDSQGYFTLDVIDPAKNPEWQKCYNNYEPGKGYMYCNLNFNMAGSILEKYSGVRFDQYVVNNVLAPLSLKGGYNINELDTTSFATIYDYNVDSAKFMPSPAAYASRKQEISRYVMGYSTPLFSPTGGMKISAPDLARYMLMHINEGRLEGHRIISRKSEQLMRTPLSNEENYGLALLTTSKLISGENLIGHTGSAYGLFSAMFFEPKEKFGFVVISNGCNPIAKKDIPDILSKTINSLYTNFIK